MTGEAGAPGTAGQGYRVPEKAGRHRAPPQPPAPPKFLRLYTPIAVLAGLGAVALPIVLIAVAVAPNATAVGEDVPVTVSTAERTARTVHIPLTILPAPVPVIGAEGAWDPDAATSGNPLSRPVPSGTFAAATGTATASTAPTERSAATVTPSSPPTTSTVATSTRTWTRTTTTTAATTPTSPAATSEPAPTSSAPTSTEEAPMAEPTETEPADVIGDALDEAVGETP